MSKGHAVAWLAHREGIPMGQVLARGDALNDLEMVGDAGHGAAMPTAPAEVRLAARYVAAPVEDDGVGRLIEQRSSLASPRTRPAAQAASGWRRDGSSTPRVGQRREAAS